MVTFSLRFAGGWGDECDDELCDDIDPAWSKPTSFPCAAHLQVFEPTGPGQIRQLVSASSSSRPASKLGLNTNLLPTCHPAELHPQHHSLPRSSSRRPPRSEKSQSRPHRHPSTPSSPPTSKTVRSTSSHPQSTSGPPTPSSRRLPHPPTALTLSLPRTQLQNSSSSSTASSSSSSSPASPSSSTALSSPTTPSTPSSAGQSSPRPPRVRS